MGCACSHRASKTVAMVKESKLAAVPLTIHNAQVMIAAARKAAAASGLFAGWSFVISYQQGMLLQLQTCLLTRAL